MAESDERGAAVDAAGGTRVRRLLEGLLYGNLGEQMATGHYGGVAFAEFLGDDRALFVAELRKGEELFGDKGCEVSFVGLRVRGLDRLLYDRRLHVFYSGGELGRGLLV